MPTTEGERRARRLWIAAHHPDRGGDPAAFVTGLAAFGGQSSTADPRLTVVRTTGPTRAAHRAWRRVVAAHRRRTHHGSIR